MDSIELKAKFHSDVNVEIVQNITTDFLVKNVFSSENDWYMKRNDSSSVKFD